MSGEKMGNLNELNDILFEQLNTLRNADKSEAEREKTIAENKAIVDTAECILKNARLQLDVMKFASDFTDIGSQNKGLIPKDDIPSIFGMPDRRILNKHEK